MIRYVFKPIILGFFMKPAGDCLSTNIVNFLRDTYGDNLRQIGEKIGVCESMVCLVANGNRSLTIERLFDIERAYDIALPKLVLKAADLGDLSPEVRETYVQFRRAVEVAEFSV